MYATAVEDGAVRFNPTRGLRIAGWSRSGITASIFSAR
jgi:hypothetical protein